VPDKDKDQEFNVYRFTGENYGNTHVHAHMNDDGTLSIKTQINDPGASYTEHERWDPNK
jgi:hypothetical protein